MTDLNKNTALTLADRAKAIDEISTVALAAFQTAESFAKELVVAQAMNDLRLALSPEVMQPIMQLMNSDLGFRTDRDPRITPKDKDGNPTVPYTMEVVRECFIESRLRGFHSVGNEWNIIAGKFYGCLNGFERKLRAHPRVSDFRDYFDVPRVVSDKGAVVKCRAEWKQDGTPQTLEREFAIRVNYGMGADAIVGKAKRKLYAAVYARLTGQVTPEGDASDLGEPINVKATVTVDATEVFKAKPAATGETGGVTQPTPTAATLAASAATVSNAGPVASTAQGMIAQIVTGEGATFDDFVKLVKVNGWLTADEQAKLTGFDDLTDAQAQKFVNARRGLVRGLKTLKG